MIMCFHLRHIVFSYYLYIIIDLDEDQIRLFHAAISRDTLFCVKTNI